MPQRQSARSIEQRVLVRQNSISSHEVDAIRHESGVHEEGVSADGKDGKQGHEAHSGFDRLAGFVSTKNFGFGFKFVDVILF